MKRAEGEEVVEVKCSSEVISWRVKPAMVDGGAGVCGLVAWRVRDSGRERGNCGCRLDNRRKRVKVEVKVE